MSGSWEDEFMEKYQDARPDEFDEFGDVDAKESLFDDDFEEEKMFDDIEEEELDEDF